MTRNLQIASKYKKIHARMRTCVLASSIGLTLTELLVTTTIIGIMMLGVVAADHSLSRGEQGASRGAVVTMRVNAMMTNITKNAALAVGTDSQRGICISSSTDPILACQAVADNVTTANTNYICFHQDFNPVVPAGADPLDQVYWRKTPGDFSDDRWVCYTRKKGAVAPNPSELFTCIFPFVVGNGPGAPGVDPCNNASDVNLGLVTDDTFTDIAGDGVDTSPKFIMNQNVGQQALAFEITLRSRYNPLIGKDFQSNPQVELSSRVAPDGHGF